MSVSKPRQSLPYQSVQWIQIWPIVLKLQCRPVTDLFTHCLKATAFRLSPLHQCLLGSIIHLVVDLTAPLLYYCTKKNYQPQPFGSCPSLPATGEGANNRKYYSKSCRRMCLLHVPCCHDSRSCDALGSWVSCDEDYRDTSELYGAWTKCCNVHCH